MSKPIQVFSKSYCDESLPDVMDDVWDSVQKDETDSLGIPRMETPYEEFCEGYFTVTINWTKDKP